MKYFPFFLIFLFCVTGSYSQDRQAAGNALLVRDYDTPAYLKRCKGQKDVEECTSNWITKFVLVEVNSSNFNITGGASFAEVDFIIGTNGKIKNIRSTGANPELNRETERITRKLPGFIPATKDGEKIEITYHLPITLRFSE